MRSILRGIVFVMGIAAAQPHGETDRPAIDAVVVRFMEAWNQHDAHALAALFAEDADFTNVMGMHVTGQKAVEAHHAPLFTGPVFKNSHLACKLRSVRFLKPDIAMVDVDWDMTGAATLDGVVRPPRKGLIDLAMARDGGQWRIAVMHNSDFTAPAPGR